MSMYYPSLTDQGDVVQTPYLLDHKLTSYQSSEPPSDKMHQNQPSVAIPYSNLLPGSLLTAHDHVEAESIRSRDGMVFIPPTGIPTSMQQYDRRMNVTPRFSHGNTVLAGTEIFPSSEQNHRGHGLSLSLGSQVQRSVKVSSDMNPYANSSFSSLLSSQLHLEDQLSQNNGLKNVEYLSFDLAGGAQSTSNYDAMNNAQNLMNAKEVNLTSSVNRVPAMVGTLCNSKYLKVARDLLDEVVNVRSALKKVDKCQFNSLGQDGSGGEDMKLDRMSSEHESTANASCELSPAERHDLQNKMTKLFSMLEEVDKRYRQYYQQMQLVVSSFDVVAGRGAAQPYTALALLTISRQFRCLRDAIKKQIQVAQKSLGEQDTTSHGQGVLSRLRYVDQQLRQQKTLQQFGIMRQSWRPQRGLPENAVSVLRAWLFEHFLHPYPKDSEKLMLARQTGLTRSQVANWFINARVRLWKPMIEDMYKEEFGDAEGESKSSPQHAVGAHKTSDFDDQGDDLHGSLISVATDGNHMVQPHDSTPHDFQREEKNMYTANTCYQTGSYQDDEVDFAANSRNISMLEGTMRNQVSLELGLQHVEKDHKKISGVTGGREDDDVASSMGLDKVEYYYADPVNQQSRFINTHLLSDFVA